MANAKDLVRSINKKILLYGPTGSGKTTQFLTLPGRKFMYVFDPGTLDTIAGHDIEYSAFLPETPIGLRAAIPPSGKAPKLDPRTKNFPEPVVYTKFEDHFLKMMNTEFEGFDVIEMHSVTSLSTITIDRIMFINGRFGQQPEISDYNILGMTLMPILRTLLSLPNKIIFIEGHSDLVQDAISKRVLNEFDITKGVRRDVPRLLTDMLVTQAEAGLDSKIIYKIQTGPTKEFPSAKCSMGLNLYEVVNIDTKRPYEGQGLGALILRKGGEIRTK